MAKPGLFPVDVAKRIYNATCGGVESEFKEHTRPSKKGGGGTGHARTPSGGVPPKVGLQMGSSVGKEMDCDGSGLLAVTTTDIQLFNPSTGSINGSTDVVYSINKAGLAVIVVEDCSLEDCSDALPVVTSTGPFTRASGSVQTITLTATGIVLNWTVTGTLPPGMAKAGSGGSATITGTPTTPGTYSVVITASNCAGSASATISITIT
jgi:hypothetical protein